MSGAPLLSNAEIADYHEKGYRVVRGAFSAPEMAVIKAETERLRQTDWLTDPNNIRSGHRTINGEVRLEKLDPVHDASPVMTALVNDERIISPLRDLWNDEPLLFKDKLIFKLPQQTGYTMHQDASFWQVFPYQDLVSVMVAIDGANAENGGLELFPGQHHTFRSTPGELRNMNAEEIAQVDTSQGELVETEPGDLIFFSSLVPHRSGTNNATVSRSQLYLTYNPSKHGNLYKAHYQHYRRYAYGDKLNGSTSYYYR